MIRFKENIKNESLGKPLAELNFADRRIIPHLMPLHF